MENQSKNNPLHGVTLQKMLEQLVSFYGFDTLGELIKIKCFTDNPSIKSSLTFLRKTDWARTKVENLYIRTLPKFPKGE
ncbi:VF530 family protein [Flavobacterium soli]|uniref:VF530 family protein n=1 Tax=Flavobacterium soli TaxID=344881 RepID=UPI00041D5F57|nr:VF530 family protein [Flavobacterium soli]